MPLNHEIWKITDEIKRVNFSGSSYENELEEILQNNIDIINENWLIIGRQVKTKFNKYIDLLAIDKNGSLVIIELKRDMTPREVVAQTLDYASWIQTLDSGKISEIFDDFTDKYSDENISFNSAYHNKFGIVLSEDEINTNHQIVIVATSLDSSTERIVNYLSDSNIAMNVVFFNIFKEGDVKYLSRVWMLDPFETSDIAATRKTSEPWNGEFYASFGDSEERNWNDAKELGFISAGGGRWYSRTLNQLDVDDRVWVNIPGVGYVGVGTVIEPAKKADEVIFRKEGREGNIYELNARANYFSENINEEDDAEYIVKVRWIKAVSKENAVSEMGFFGNQNTICKPTTQKWRFTIDRLKEIWNLK